MVMTAFHSFLQSPNLRVLVTPTNLDEVTRPLERATAPALEGARRSDQVGLGRLARSQGNDGRPACSNWDDGGPKAGKPARPGVKGDRGGLDAARGALRASCEAGGCGCMCQQVCANPHHAEKPA